MYNFALPAPVVALINAGFPAVFFWIGFPNEKRNRPEQTMKIQTEK